MVAAMATFYKTSRVWVLEFTYDGRPRRWFRPLPAHEDGAAFLAAQLRDLYGGRATFVEARPATADEETQYIRGELPVNVFCPSGYSVSSRSKNER
jgi:hypothetical protein